MDLKTKLYIIFSAFCGALFLMKLVPILLAFKANKGDEQALRPTGFALFQTHSIAVFLMAMMANWFYGSHLMELYDNYGFNQLQKSILLSIGFLTAGISGLFIGNVADAIGRKKACIMYALCYGVTVLCHHFKNIYIISIGRATAGVATSLLYCVFESWMIAAHNKRNFPGHLLGQTFSWAWGLNYPVAIVTGILCEEVTSKVPWGLVGDFDASAIVMLIMVITICVFWDENYGEHTTSLVSNFKAGFLACHDSWNVKMLSMIQTFFEGSMFIFVRFWWDVLHDAYGAYPAGVVFALFMINAMLGTELLRFLKMFISKQVISVANCAVAAACWMLIALDWTPVGKFETKLILFCIYEITVGIYFNVMTDLRGELIEDSVRASVTALCRVPMNVIVASLMLSNAKANVQFFCLAAFNAIAMISAMLLRNKQEAKKAKVPEKGTELI